MLAQILVQVTLLAPAPLFRRLQCAHSMFLASPQQQFMFRLRCRKLHRLNTCESYTWKLPHNTRDGVGTIPLGHNELTHCLRAYRNGIAWGKTIRYYRTGKIYSRGQFINNELNGKYNTYYESGALKSDEMYVNNERHGVCYGFYETDGIKERIEYVKGQYHGSCAKFYTSGQIKCQATYIKDSLHGKYIDYYESGNIHEIRNYINGNYHGEHFIYYDGSADKTLNTLNEYLVHDNGVLTERTIYDRAGTIIQKEDLVRSDRDDLCADSVK